MRTRYRSFWQFWWSRWFIIPTLTCPILVVMTVTNWGGDPVWLRVLWGGTALLTAWQATDLCRRQWRAQLRTQAKADETAAEAHARIVALEGALDAGELSDADRAHVVAMLLSWRSIEATSLAERVRINPDPAAPAELWVVPA